MPASKLTDFRSRGLEDSLEESLLSIPLGFGDPDFGVLCLEEEDLERLDLLDFLLSRSY